MKFHVAPGCGEFFPIGNMACFARLLVIRKRGVIVSRSPRRMKKKYRPGIDDPPPSKLAWFAGIVGISSLLAVMAAASQRLRKHLRKDQA